MDDLVYTFVKIYFMEIKGSSSVRSNVTRCYCIRCMLVPSLNLHTYILSIAFGVQMLWIPLLVNLVLEILCLAKPYFGKKKSLICSKFWGKEFTHFCSWRNSYLNHCWQFLSGAMYIPKLWMLYFLYPEIIV